MHLLPQTGQRTGFRRASRCGSACWWPERGHLTDEAQHSGPHQCILPRNRPGLKAGMPAPGQKRPFPAVWGVRRAVCCRVAGRHSRLRPEKPREPDGQTAALHRG
jgi:hypothetical protein